MAATRTLACYLLTRRVRQQHGVEHTAWHDWLGRLVAQAGKTAHFHPRASDADATSHTSLSLLGMRYS